MILLYNQFITLGTTRSCWAGGFGEKFGGIGRWLEAY